MPETMTPGSRRKGNLPGELTELVGRAREVRQIRVILTRTRLLTLSGVGGVGKSRLAVGAARRVERSFAGGAWLAEFAAIGDPRFVSNAVVRSLGVPERPGESSEQSIARFLRGEPALLLLDNCEHVLEAAAELAYWLLEACPSLRVVATSREHLGLEGEVTLAVPPLEVPKVDGLVRSADDALGFGAVRLFVDRATAADPAFVLTEANVSSVIEVCRRLEGIPLGLELAAVRMRTLSLDDLRTRLDDQLSLSNLSGRSSLARHQTLAATLDWSHDMLNANERLLWYRLSIFAGGFTIQAAERVCSDDLLPTSSVFDTLTALLEKSLVVLERDKTAVRYRLLEPVRLYGLGRLRSDGAECAMRRRHLCWCLEWTAGLGQWQSGIDEQELKHVVDERANILTALDFSVTVSDDAARGLELTDRIARAWLACEWARELSYYGEVLLQKVTDPPRIRARLYYAIGVAAVTLGDATRARKYFEDCRSLVAGRRGHDLEQGLARLGLGLVALLGGDGKHATGHLRRAIEQLERAGATVMQVEGMCWLASAMMGEERTQPQAEPLVERALELNEQVGDDWNHALARWLLGVIELGDGRAEAAETSFLRSLRLWLRDGIGRGVGVAHNLQGLAFTAAAANQNPRAAQLMGAADILAEELGHSLSQLTAASRHDWEHLVRVALGDQPFAEHYDTGRALPREEAIRLALAEKASRDHPSSGEKETLTRREAEIARLVATGATNRKIANQLVISDQTVKFHVHNILVKLGFDSRAEIVAWEVRHTSARSHANK